MPLIQRKQILRSLLPAGGADNTPQAGNILQFSDHIATRGQQLFTQMQKRGLEGMVAKRADSRYREATRGPDWLKIKTHLRQEVVIGGYTEPRGSRKYLGSLLAGVYQNGELHYVGHSGGGIPDNARKALQARLAKLERKTSPFAREPKPNAPVHWVRPELVCEMSFSQWTEGGLMRHPQFEGLRPDKSPWEVRREQAVKTSPKLTSKNLQNIPKDEQHPKQNSRPQPKPHRQPRPSAAPQTSLKLPHDLPFEPTHLTKIFFPKHHYTKGDLLRYYESVAEFILPYLQNRPCSLNRMPHGITGESFFQKNNEHLPEWVPHADIFSESNRADLRWIVGGQLETLLYMVQLGCVELNPWSSRVGHLDEPDWLVIDLDPEGISFASVITVARTVKQVCDEWGIASYPKTSGKTGLHIYVPLQAKYSYEQAKNLAHLIALEVNRRQPKLTSVERLPIKRRHKIYLDFLQNRAGQTLAAPYSVRPTSDATVSMPLHWDEVRAGLRPTDFTMANAARRLRRTGDLWGAVIGKGIELAATLATIQKQNLLQ